VTRHLGDPYPFLFGSPRCVADSGLCPLFYSSNIYPLDPPDALACPARIRWSCPYTRLISMSHQPTHNVHPYPICQVAIRRLNVTKPTVSTTNHLPATSGATNPADTHHHITTHTSEDPPNDETGGKAPTLSSFQFQLSGEGMPPRSVIPILMQRGGWIPPCFIFVSISMRRRGCTPPSRVVNP